MKILWIVPDVPQFPGNGSSAAAYFLLKHLSRNNAVTLVTIIRRPADYEKLEKIRPLCHAVHTLEKQGSELGKQLRGSLAADAFEMLRFLLMMVSHPWAYSPNMFPASLRSVLAELDGDYDVVLVEHSNAAQGVKGFPANRNTVRALYWENVHSLRLGRALHEERGILKKLMRYAEYVRMVHYEQSISPTFDQNFLLSNEERDALIRSVKTASLCVAPFGVDVDYFASWPHTTTIKDRIVCTGTFNHQVHVNGMLYFCREILPLIWQRFPEAELWMVGKDPDRQLLELAEVDCRIVVTGAVPDVRPFMAEGQVYVVPIKIAAGVRIKILEALAMGKAVVATSVGCEGWGLQDGRHLCVADTPQSFADAVCVLMGDAQMRERLGQQGQDYVRKNYDWSVLAPRFEALLQDASDMKTKSEGRRAGRRHE